jgi:hypothetical protein
MNDMKENEDFVDMMPNDDINRDRDIFMNLDELYVYKGEKISS